MDLLIETAGGVAAYGMFGLAVVGLAALRERRQKVAAARRRHPAVRTLRDAA